jgi:RNA polymerase sigma-70 factor (sigma-E family)
MGVMLVMEAPVDTATVAQPATFEEFFAVHYRAVCRSLQLAIGDPGRAEDLAQDAFAKACKRWRRVSVMERPATWVYVVAVNAERKRLRNVSRALDTSPVVSEVRDGATAVDARLDVRQALGRLAPRQRMAVVLRYLVGLRTSEIAEAMGCAEGTVKSTIDAALRRLRIDLEETD